MFKVSKYPLETKRLFLRSLTLDDVVDVYNYASVEGVGEKAGWKHHKNIEETYKVVNYFIQDDDVYAIVDKTNCKVIGTLGVHEIDETKTKFGDRNVREIGFVLSKEYWGQGIIPEAVRAVIDLCFNELDIDVLVCCHFEGNIQSKRVIEKSGFKYLDSRVVIVNQMDNAQLTSHRYVIEKKDR